jgi:hypothetical protein
VVLAGGDERLEQPVANRVRNSRPCVLYVDPHVFARLVRANVDPPAGIASRALVIRLKNTGSMPKRSKGSSKLSGAACRRTRCVSVAGTAGYDVKRRRMSDMIGKMQVRRPLRLGAAFALLLGSSYPALALDARSPAAAYLRSTFTTEDGLGANVINDILQSRAGFLWIASHTGVTRFDSQHFNHVPFPQLIVNVNSITEGQDGDLWLGTMAGIIRISHSRSAWRTSLDRLSSWRGNR